LRRLSYFRAPALPQSSGNELTYLQIVASTAKAEAALYAIDNPTSASLEDTRLSLRPLPIPGMSHARFEAACADDVIRFRALRDSEQW
jgi:hypothetical protein